MAFTRPTDYPRWTVLDDGAATDNDVTNPTSGKLNVVEPTELKKDLGWDFKEFPPRQWFNWLARIVAKWIYWLDQEAGRLESAKEDKATQTAYNGTLYGCTSPVAVTVIITKMLTPYRIYFVKFRSAWGTSNSNDCYIEIPGTVEDPAIDNGYSICQVINDSSSGNYSPASVRYSYNPTTHIGTFTFRPIAKANTNTHIYAGTGFEMSGVKGTPDQTVIFS